MGRVLPFTPPEEQGTPDDVARERRIRELASKLQRAIKRGPWGVSEAMELQQAMAEEIARRSPEQVARIERARGLCR